MTTSGPTVERGSGNVFADLGHPEADTHLLKADLVGRIDTIIRQRGITQTEAACLLGLTSPTCRGCSGATSASIPWSACSAC